VNWPGSVRGEVATGRRERAASNKDFHWRKERGGKKKHEKKESKIGSQTNRPFVGILRTASSKIEKPQ